MQAPYIPPKDAILVTWALNFAALITATPATYGLVAGDATTINGVVNAFSAAYTIAIDPPTRTKPTVAAKDAAKADMLAVVRPYAIQVRNNAGVSNMDKEDLGLNVPDLTPTPVPAPSTFPLLSFIGATPQSQTYRYADSNSPDLRAKPFGALACQMYVSVGVTAAVDPAQMDFKGNFTKNPTGLVFLAGDVGKIASVAARWVTRSGPLGVAQVGPWSSISSHFIV